MSISKNIGVTYISQIAGVLISVASTIYLSRILGAQGRGEFTIYTNSVTFFNLFIGLSLPSTIVYSIANKRVDENKLFSTLIFYTLISTLFVALTLQLFFYFQCQSLIFAKDKETFLWKGIFIIHFLSITFNNLLIAFLNAKQKFILSSVVGLINILIPFAGYLIIYYNPFHFQLTQHYMYVVLLVVFSFLLTTTLMFSLIRKYYTNLILFSFLNKKDILFVLQFSLIAWICNFFSTLTYRMDVWFIDHYHGKIETGVYSLAVNLSQFFWVLPNAIGSVLYSYIAKDGVQQNLQSIQRLTKYTFYFNVFAGLMAILLLKSLIPFFYGNDFTDSYMLLVLLIPGVVIFSFTIVLAAVYAGTGKIIINLYNTIFSFLICLVLDILMIKTMSAKGASIASSITYIISTIFSIFVASKLYNFKIKDMFLIKKEDIMFLKGKFIK